MLKWQWIFSYLGVFLCFSDSPLTSSSKDTNDHAIYISTVKIQHNTSDSLAQITFNVFSDDLQDCLHHAFPKEEEIKTKSICELSPELINTYFNQHFQCQINQQHHKIQWLDCEALTESHLLTFQMPCPANWEALQIKADFLMELFPTQSNVIQIKNKDQQFFARATIDQKIHQFTYTP